ncbi:F-box/LRR-repeat protein At3g59190-like isoform X3 [Rhododendron vialii]|uniref:F-box/LRR-repeat protein At3g59190-like isoform X3 n=1 Tax=Rhododendron vialii TaxID=182163 RepID=UPI00265F7EB6|nr:F-box/LRR-repeat protein At3g59190-like isoform X3 [Rhododendron vialii]
MEELTETKDQDQGMDKIDNIDCISYFPDDVIFNVMDFLSTKEVVRSCLLSKRWQHMQAYYPNLDFDQTYFGRELAIRKPKSGNLVERYPDLEEKRDNFIRYVDETLLRFHEQGLRIRKFNLFFTIFESSMVSLVDKWIGLATEGRVEELHLRMHTPLDALYILPQTVFATKSIKTLKLENFKLEQLLHQSISFSSLQKLSLICIHVDAPMIASIISSCPLIEEIELIKCLGLYKVHISDLHNLRVVVIVQHHGVIDAHIEAPSLQKLRYEDGNFDTCPCKFNLIGCHNLTDLTLRCVLVSDQQFTDLLSKFPLLEALRVLDCRLLERVKISNQHLRRLKLCCLKLEEVEIDAPKLQSFFYFGGVIPMITATSTSGQWEGNIELYSNRCMNSHSFWKMRNLVAQSQSFKLLTLSIHCREISFTVEEIKDILFPLVPMVDRMKLKLRSSSEGYSALLDGLLWSCHPKILSVKFMDLESRRKFILVLREKIVHKLDLNCEHLESILGWQHELKDVECHVGDGKPPNWNALSDDSLNLQKRPKLHATFKWANHPGELRWKGVK